MVTLLHISDLHRSPVAPTPNSFLLSCLLLDIQRHQNDDPVIPKCDGIVVTGDLVEGVSLEDREPEKTMKEQYLEAKDFLVSLCDRLLDGNRARIFIAPGNHDVNWPMSYRAMSRLTSKPQRDIRRALSDRDTPIRWSWGEYRPYVIKDPHTYGRRLELYKEFFDDFYRGLGHTFSLDPSKQTVNFVLPESQIVLTSFCSLYGNDCFNRRGRISQDAIAVNDLELRSKGMAPTLKIAIWHHSPATSSYQEDCLDSFDTLPLLMDRGYVIGLHGHQHHSSVTTFSDAINPGQYMPLVGCGSLCAGPYDIPPGYRRHYNVIEIDENTFNLRVHAREWFNNQIWIAAKLPEWNWESWIDLKLPLLEFATQEAAKTAESSRLMANVGNAERAVKSKDFRRAIALLKSESSEIPLVRKLLLLSYREEGEWQEIIGLIGDPTNEDEVVSLFDAYVQLKRLNEINELLKRASARGLSPLFIAELRKRLEVERSIGDNP